MASVENPGGPESKDQEAAADDPPVDKYNVEAAEALASEVLRLPIAEAVPIYEQLLGVFPTCAKYWKQYVEAHMAANNDDATRLIFSRCLLNCLQVPLWRCYIRYIRKINDKKGLEGHEETRKAFLFMLNYVGGDMAAGPVWMEYIAFLKSLPALNAQEESQRMTAIRKAYQTAIVTPCHHIEQLWKEYENFENSVSRQLAKGLVSEYQPKYNSARAVYRERKKYVDEIDWNMLAVPPSGSYKEEMQWMAWKRLLAFEKGNPQRIDAASANKRIEFTYEQCLMYLYHYPDIWYDYATWHAKSGSTDAAIKVFQRALKALPESELLRYAYLELEESRGATPEAKQVYESLFTDGTRNTSLAQIQYIRFLRRTEGVEAARKYFLDARKSPNCTYHVYVAYAMIAFCLDKEPKMAHNVFEAGLKRFMNEPAYILEYADFLSRLNDDKNIRALFERALSSLPAEGSVEVWKRFVEFEQTYGDLASMLKVEQRRKEALSGTTEDEASALEGSLQDIVSRYRFMDLWPCSSQELDHLSRQEWLTRNFNKKSDKLAVSNGAGLMERGLLGPSTSSSDVIYPDTSQMVVYDPRQKTGMPTPMATGPAVAAPSNITNPVPVGVGGNITNAFDEILKATPQALAAFLATLPAVEGPTPDVDIVLSICLQSNIPAAPIGKPGAPQKQSSTGPALSGSEVSTSSKSHPVRSGSSFKQTGDRQAKKRKDLNRQEDEETTTVQSQPLPRDVFRMRQIQKARAATSSQTGSASYGSAFSGDLSGSTG
ncbi:cleavage stimulation factor subunit 77 isoform X1 [Punica granatum]|uniref:Cleavage stimulation factor subunit 77 isoform X1 n=1 Tax=Punica granatum TaxID=22663 RepID=A0A6P8BNR0_PUNGR|nr:cleavage stimulation factor subunit 77 isoform X1 [Punica granatum]